MRIERLAGPTMHVADGFGAIASTARVPVLVDTVLAHGGTVLGAIVDGELSGYAAVIPAVDHWAGLPDTYELGSLEIARSSRRRGLATALLAALGDAIHLDRVIVLARAMAGHWDFEQTRLSAYGYRGLLRRVLARQGFEFRETSDPEVLEHPLNFLAVRTGARVPERVRELVRQR